jgi:predicted membrane channel-forming protein YqfA (hemolysin III family)
MYNFIRSCFELNRLSDRTKNIIVLILAGILILMGLVQALFKVELPEKVNDEVSFIIMMMAAFLLFSKKRRYRKDKQEDDDIEDVKKDESIEMIEKKKED